MNKLRSQLLAQLNSISGLETVEALIVDKFVSEVPILSEIPQYLFDLGGKRIRPVLCLLTWKTLTNTPPSTQLIDIAAGIELIHMATMMHDDIIDRSPTRRHKQSPFSRYGLGDTLITGDFLLTRAFSLCARLDRTIIDLTEQACIELTEGEILETAYPLQEYSIETSMTIARKKTAALFRLAAECAAHLAGAPSSEVQRAREYGEYIGIGFQILDDILDVTSTEEALGKKAGIDILERKPSAVNIHWLKSGDRRAYNCLLGDKTLSDDELKNTLDYLSTHEAVEKSKDLARSYCSKAIEAISGLNQVKDAEGLNDMQALAQFSIDRLG